MNKVKDLFMCCFSLMDKYGERCTKSFLLLAFSIVHFAFYTEVLVFDSSHCPYDSEETVFVTVFSVTRKKGEKDLLEPSPGFSPFSMKLRVSKNSEKYGEILKLFIREVNEMEEGFLGSSLEPGDHRNYEVVCTSNPPVTHHRGDLPLVEFDA